MEINLSGRDLILLLVVLSMSFFILGFFIDQQETHVLEQVTTDRLLPIYRVDRADKKIAITIDGMWGAEYTPEILNILEENNVNITFFFGGNWLEEYPEYVKEIAAKGHEVGNHSYSHPHMNNLSREEIIKELKQTEKLIKDLTGRKWNLFRPPFGEYNNLLIKTCNELDYYPIQWSIDSLDWKDVSTDFICQRVLDNIGPGEIVLMHNNAENTPKALKRLIPKLKEKGYEIVPLSEMIYEDNYYIEQHSGTQKARRRNETDEL